jgi:two-component system, OmpR family, response regulator
MEIHSGKRYYRGGFNPGPEGARMARKILVADDDPHIREVVSFALEKAGMQAVPARDGREALEFLKKDGFALVVLDINMPEMDGLDVCKELRKVSQVPVLFLSSRDDEIDRVIGLEIGGDDYVTKPFSPRELVARVNAILKRTGAKAPAKEDKGVLQCGQIALDPEKFQARFGDKDVALTSTEFAILKGMMRRPEKVFERDNIIDIAYSANIHVSDRTIDSHIRHIRQKFLKAGCKSVIETVHGVGYKLGTCL